MDSERFSRAVALRDAGKEVAALREFEELATLESDANEKSSLVLNQANCLWRLGRLKEGRQRLAEAAMSGSTPFTEFLDACMCVTEGKNEEAVQKLGAFLKSHGALKESEHSKVYFDAADELGTLLFNLGRFGDAIEPIEEALTVTEGDHHKTLCFYLGVCHYQAERWEAAEERLIQSLPADHRDPWSLQAQYYLGLCHCMNRRWDAAADCLLRSLPADRRDPLWAPAQYQLGCVYFHQGAYLKAKSAFELCEFFFDDAERKENIVRWLTATRTKLGEWDEPKV